MTKTELGLAILLLGVGGTMVAIPVGSDLWEMMRVSTYSAASDEVRLIARSANAMRMDSGKKSLRDLFEPKAFDDVCAWYVLEKRVNEFEASVAVYSCAVYALLENGTNSLDPALARDDPLLARTQAALHAETIDQLKDKYLETVGTDAWGNPYRFFLGPWPHDMGPILLRRYRSQQSMEPQSTPGDQLTLTGIGPQGLRVGFPASRDRLVYVWSFGENEVSDQPRYDPTHAYKAPAREYYRRHAADIELGGGDDIVSWDENRTDWLRYKPTQQKSSCRRPP